MAEAQVRRSEAFRDRTEDRTDMVEMMGLHFVNVSAHYLLSRIDYRGT